MQETKTVILLLPIDDNTTTIKYPNKYYNFDLAEVCNYASTMIEQRDYNLLSRFVHGICSCECTSIKDIIELVLKIDNPKLIKNILNYSPTCTTLSILELLAKKQEHGALELISQHQGIK